MAGREVLLDRPGPSRARPVYPDVSDLVVEDDRGVHAADRIASRWTGEGRTVGRGYRNGCVRGDYRRSGSRWG